MNKIKRFKKFLNSMMMGKIKSKNRGEDAYLFTKTTAYMIYKIKIVNKNLLLSKKVKVNKSM